MRRSSIKNKDVWLEDEQLGYVPVRLIKNVSETNATSPSSSTKQQYTALRLKLNSVGKLKAWSKSSSTAIPLTTIELSLKDLELLDPVKADTMHMVCDNLSDLPNIDAGLVLHHLRNRFKNGQTFTLSGKTLVSINPAARLPELPERAANTVWSTLEHYNTTPDQHIDPHIYSFAGNLYHHVCSNGHDNQFFVTVRGKQGSGKTDCVERIIEYLVNVSRGGSDSQLGVRLCSACSILDVFTHVRSVRNISSSRACQTVKMEFNERNGVLTKWNLTAPLLDTGGLLGAWKDDKEYNFNIFYFLLAGMTDSELHGMGITSRDPSNFPCLVGSDKEEQEMHREEYDQWLDDVYALDIGTEVTEVMRAVIAVLHLSLLQFDAVKQDASKAKTKTKNTKQTEKVQKPKKIEQQTKQTVKKDSPFTIPPFTGSTTTRNITPDDDSASTCTVKLKQKTTEDEDSATCISVIANLLGVQVGALTNFFCCPDNAETWSVGRAELRRNVFANEIYQRAVSELVAVLNKRGTAIGDNGSEYKAIPSKRSITLLDPCISTQKGANSMHQLQELRTQYMDVKLRQFRDESLAKELELYHVEGVLDISPFWPGNDDEAKSFDNVTNILDGTQDKIPSELDVNLLELLEKAGADLKNTNSYDWKHVLLETWATHAAQKETASLLQKSTNSVLFSEMSSSLWLSTNGSMQSLVGHIKDLAQGCDLREVSCIQANALFRPLALAPSHCLEQLRVLDIISPAKMGRVGYANKMTATEFYHWLYRLVPSLSKESPRKLTLDHDSMTKMFKTVAGCEAIHGLLKVRKGSNYLDKCLTNIRIGKTLVFIKHDQDYDKLDQIHKTVWKQPVIVAQSFLRMCVVRTLLARQAQEWLEKSAQLKRQAEKVEMQYEDEQSTQRRKQYQEKLAKEKMKQDKIQGEKDRLEAQVAEAAAVVAEAVAVTQERRNVEQRRVNGVIEARKRKRRAAIQIQSFVRRIICQSRVECALSCLALLDATSIHTLHHAVHRGSRTLLRWRTGTSRLMKMLTKARVKLAELEEKQVEHSLRHHLKKQERLQGGDKWV